MFLPPAEMTRAPGRLTSPADSDLLRPQLAGNYFMHHDDHPHIISRNARYGLTLFAVYVLLYGGFVFLAVFRTDIMGAAAPGGVNVAIAYGFALIGVALLLALIYMALCRGPAGKQDGSRGGESR